MARQIEPIDLQDVFVVPLAFLQSAEILGTQRIRVRDLGSGALG